MSDAGSSGLPNANAFVRKVAAFETRLDLVERVSLDARHDSQVARVMAKAVETQLRGVADRLTRLVIEAAERAARDSANLAEIRRLAEGMVTSVEARNREILEALTGAVLR